MLKLLCASLLVRFGLVICAPASDAPLDLISISRSAEATPISFGAVGPIRYRVKMAYSISCDHPRAQEPAEYESEHVFYISCTRPSKQPPNCEILTVIEGVSFDLVLNIYDEKTYSAKAHWSVRHTDSPFKECCLFTFFGTFYIKPLSKKKELLSVKSEYRLGCTTRTSEFTPLPTLCLPFLIQDAQQSQWTCTPLKPVQIELLTDSASS
ncbi:hypothetical protein E5Q_00764 [Mixia osmundae IAM 14324]|uniref:Autophagy-related protein 27 n=1 Tax=Mixia osmundae (strain CBS 9802 / IAM 14324 / JCM 22182 / KY 12970) TaxID=764103 RepID=G7DU57_MIXOS|nr:hypothetical protein E5Q_00764 [Mixia osmundae IAM 14324]